jgi:translation initiation factor eIF-2B subunit delta
MFERGREGRATQMIASHAVNKIADGDVVLTYAHSAVVVASLLEAHRLGRQFRVVVVNSRPLNEGRQTLATLLQAGLACQYIHINALAYIMREVTKVGARGLAAV